MLCVPAKDKEEGAMEKCGQLYEGKAKKVYATDDPSLYIVSYKDDATAFNGEKKGTIVGKGVVNNTMSNIVFALIEEAGVPTHFVKQLSDRDTLVKAVTIFPLEVIIRNVSAGSFSKRYGVEEGIPFARPTLEFSIKNDDLGDPLINDDHVIALGLATDEELAVVRDYAHKVNEIMTSFFIDRGLKLIDFKIEFGRLPDGTVILADEVSPDTCRLWDVETNEKMDKDRFRRDLGNVEETYRAVLARVKGE
jgi:phosphoribosylaminoimidazole-succinocarboxamide synthase